MMINLHKICTSSSRTNKEYLINCHILLQYFELVFLQLQLIQILCKLMIIRVNYEKTKGVFFYETPFSSCVAVQIVCCYHIQNGIVVLVSISYKLCM